MNQRCCKGHMETLGVKVFQNAGAFMSGLILVVVSFVGAIGEAQRYAFDRFSASSVIMPSVDVPLSRCLSC